MDIDPATLARTERHLRRVVEAHGLPARTPIDGSILGYVPMTKPRDSIAAPCVAATARPVTCESDRDLWSMPRLREASSVSRRLDPKGTDRRAT